MAELQEAQERLEAAREAHRVHCARELELAEELKKERSVVCAELEDAELEVLELERQAREAALAEAEEE